ncbi:chaxapeptin family lasso peptide [Streptomyces sp. SHP 1-2]|nr:chaxapeptin family lasso peptide [Streptomyces sp. SHP 1-2]MCW5252885.1 chaxapeptin family lasso peptide [Streptomyces sp. SHP 1-2]
MESQVTEVQPEAYEAPSLIEVGEFSEDTLGFGSKPLDSFGLNFL